ncbi:hypothetical protein ACWELO_10795 [Streptomyces sp. NPDC004596]
MTTAPDTGAPAIAGLLATAEALLSESLGGPLTQAGRARGAAYALRIALEAAVDATLLSKEAGFCGVRSMRAKLLCLRHYVGLDLAHRVTAFWSRLSAGCKYQHDEIGPSHSQVCAWQAAVAALVTELAAPGVTLALPQQKGVRQAPLDETPAKVVVTHHAVTTRTGTVPPATDET